MWNNNPNKHDRKYSDHELKARCPILEEVKRTTQARIEGKVRRKYDLTWSCPFRKECGIRTWDVIKERGKDYCNIEIPVVLAEVDGKLKMFGRGK